VSKTTTDKTHVYLKRFINGVKKRNPGEREFHQAVSEVAETIFPYIADKPIYHKMQILERMAEPDRVIMFRVPWTDDAGNIRNQRGYRVQFNNSIGPYKGGLRFHPSVNLSVLKFLGFEQTFKNSLTGLPMGGAKGGSDFNPKGKSDNEVMRFCQSFMIELHRHIGEDTDIPAGDIGVGAREIGYLFGQYKRIENRFVGVLTGKGMAFGGSKIRTEATGYGAVYFMQNMLEYKGDDMRGKTVTVSGSGNVASYAVEKVNHLGGKVVTLSDSSGFIHDPDGINAEKLDFVLNLKNVQRGRISEYVDTYKSASFHEGRPWSVPCDIALPCATQNEISREDAETLVKNGCMGVSEGANMPTYLDGINVFQEAGILYAPSKAANAGGVAVSGLEMSQNSSRISWDEAELDKLLKATMLRIHDSCVEYGKTKDGVDYLAGANIAGFIKVADAMLSFGHT
jgi:glutamate dehydrogenase (NADP+)